MKIVTREIEIQTAGELDIIPLTEKVIEMVRHSGVETGIVNISSQHTTVGIFINEFEQGYFQDLRNALRRIVPKEIHYTHNDLHVRKVQPGELQNGHSHIMATLIGTAQTIPVQNGKIKLGTWQSIFLIELDAARQRRVTVTIIGD